MSSSKTVLITGASSGIGKATAELFAERGWNVAATMRSPNESDLASKSQAIRLFRLDVTDPSSIETCVSDVIAEFGGIDVVVNNAGYGLVGPFEAQTDAQIRRQFETNLFGVMNVTRAVLPHMRERRAGRIVNVASIAGRMTIPLYSAYCSTKWALEGLGSALARVAAPEHQGQDHRAGRDPHRLLRTLSGSGHQAGAHGLRQLRFARVAQRPGVGGGRSRACGRGKKHLEGFDQHLAAAALPSERRAADVLARSGAGQSLCARRAAHDERVVIR